jgi:hypothetical protein
VIVMIVVFSSSLECVMFQVKINVIIHMIMLSSSKIITTNVIIYPDDSNKCVAQTNFKKIIFSSQMITLIIIELDDIIP